MNPIFTSKDNHGLNVKYDLHKNITFYINLKFKLFKMVICVVFNYNLLLVQNSVLIMIRFHYIDRIHRTDLAS